MEVCEALNDLGFRTRTGKLWRHPQQIVKLLKVVRLNTYSMSDEKFSSTTIFAKSVGVKVSPDWDAIS